MRFAVPFIAALSFAGAAYAEDIEARKKEMVTFVKEVVEFAKKNGKEATCKLIEDKSSKFWRGDMYIYAYDFACNVVCHGLKPMLKGQNLRGVKDPKGNEVNVGLMNAAKKGGDFYFFYWPHPQKKDKDGKELVAPKIGYAEKVDDNWWLGSGIYPDEDPTAAKPEAKK